MSVVGNACLADRLVYQRLAGTTGTTYHAHDFIFKRLTLR